MDWFLSLRKNKRVEKENVDENRTNVFHTLRRKLNSFKTSDEQQSTINTNETIEDLEENNFAVFMPPIDIRDTYPDTQQNISTVDLEMESTRKLLKKYSWFWPNLSRSAAQAKLSNQANGCFLVRDSQTIPDQFTLSFRSSGCTLHVRIDYKNNEWSFIDNIRSRNLVNLIDNTVMLSKNSILGYVKQNCFPVRLNYPILRPTETLEELCLNLIKFSVAPSNIDRLPLPIHLKNLLVHH